jgi:hypothetical protein
MLTAGAARGVLHLEAPAWDGARTMALGGIRAADPADAAGLLRIAVDRARALGAGALIGPMDGDTWRPYRLPVESDGRPPFLMEPTAPPHLHRAFLDAGFAELARYFSAARPLTPTAPDPCVRPWEGEDPEALFAQVHALSTRAFAGNAFYRPIALEAFLAMYMPMVPLLKPELVLFARDGDRLIGFLFGIPDYAQGPAPEAAILKSYASLAPGAGRALATTFHANAAAMGYGSAIHALIHEDNRSAARSRREGAGVFRRYALMGRRLV